MIFSIVLKILASQCFFAAVSYLIDIIKTMVSHYFSKRYSHDSFYYKYGTYIQSVVACSLFLIIGLIIYSVVDYIE
ncbi:virion membrane protein [Alphaentomopoxvirus acuprea]|uniref:Virion membrane protein n=1 Tax=Alphaentomopoxvirus acuprea TaxID=62099 RepID=W6JPL0_9POXV|nr:virion membrane protein [Anomala cuprea entomopoxvirus]BAO49464.1 virion membrane protein [Anomala cuprea entomopoxvirus]